MDLLSSWLENGVCIKLLNFFRNHSGFTLPEVMVATAILGGVAVVMLQLTKDQTSAKVRGQVASDLSQLRTQIQAIYLNPASCNANFVGRVANGSNITVSTPDGIRKCKTSATITCSAGAAADYNIEMPIHATSWEKVSTKLPDRLRIKSIVYNLKQGTALYRTISEALVTIEVETLPNITKKDAVSGNQVTKIVTETLKFSVPIIVNGTTVVGCPKSWNSTVPYGSTI